MATPSWMRPILLLAALQVAAGLVGLAATGARPPASAAPIPPWASGFFATVFATAAAVLVAGARTDARPACLGGILLMVAASYANRLIPRLGEAFALEPLATVLAGLPAEAFLAPFVWLFFRDFPRAPVPPLARRIVDGMVGVSLAIAAGLFAVHVLLLGEALAGERGPLPPWLERLSLADRVGPFWVLVYGITLPAGLYALWKTTRAGPSERRRVAVFMTGFAVGTLPIGSYVLLLALSQGFRAWVQQPEIHAVAMPVVHAGALLFAVSSAYAVLVERVLDVRLVLRRALQYTLARGTVLAASAVPFLAAGLWIARHRDRTVGDLLSGRAGLALAAGLMIGVLGLRFRRPLLDAVDRRFFREQYDARQLMARLGERVRAARTPEALGATLHAELDGALHLERVHALVAEVRDGQERLAPLREGADVLALTEPVKRLLADVPNVLDLESEEGADERTRLDPTARSWLARQDARLLVPLRTGEGELLGVLALGAKRSELPFTREDRLLISAAASTAAMVLENLLIRSSIDARDASARPPWLPAGRDEAPARECASCGTLHAPDTSQCPRCGGGLHEAALAHELLGKFRVEARLGEGGAGVVYRAQDLTLGRHVAIKTLPVAGSREQERLHREARAVAAFQHPHLATIFGAESWRGTPFLVFEYLAGGTLADRMRRRGPLPGDDVRAIALDLASALGRVHDAGMLHRDVKPSNVGFTDEGTVKLLDFGLAAILGDAAVIRPKRLVPAGPAPDTPASRRSTLVSDVLVGTPLYLSPEALQGRPPDVSFDLWALALSLYEALCGRNPLERATWNETMDCILRGEVPPVAAFAPDAPADLALLLDEALAADPRRRPRDAGVWLSRLRARAST